MLSKSRARELAGEALVFVASDGDLVAEMLSVSGMQPADLRAAATSPEFSIFLLDFILQADQRVLDFARAQRIAPESVLQAREVLSHASSAMSGDG